MTQKTKETTLDLLAQYRLDPTLANRNEVVVANLGLVEKLAYRFSQNSREPYHDLYTVGCIGLIKAVERFNLAMGRQFSSYAVACIRGEMQHYQRDQCSPGGLKLPRTWVDQRRKILNGDFSGIPQGDQALAIQALQYHPLRSLSHGPDGHTAEIAAPPQPDPVLSVPPADGEYFNATAICKRYGRRFVDWRRLPSTARLIQHFSSQRKKVRQSHLSPIISVRGRGGASWVHRDLSAEFLRWVHPEAAAAVCYAYSAAVEAQLR